MEEEQDVQVESSPTEQDVNEEAVQPQEEAESQEVESAQTPAGVGQPLVQDVDEMGVPFKNRYMEMRRKYEDTDKTLKEVLESVKGLQQGQQQKPQYSEAELQTFANQSDISPHERSWALKEVERLREEKVAKTVRSVFTEFQQKQKEEVNRQQSLMAVQSRYPEAFVKNNAGQIVGWNSNSPLYQRINAYMNDPDIAKNPRGLLAAAALAAQDLAYVQKPQTQKQTQAMKREIKNLQKQTLIEGGGKPAPVKKSSKDSALDLVREKGDVESAQLALKEILKVQKAHKAREV
jgi:hypothetical protein